MEAIKHIYGQSLFFIFIFLLILSIEIFKIRLKLISIKKKRKRWELQIHNYYFFGVVSVFQSSIRFIIHVTKLYSHRKGRICMSVSQSVKKETFFLFSSFWLYYNFVCIFV